MFYHLTDDEKAYREGPFATLTEARRVASEVDRDLFPVEIWIQAGSRSVWKYSRSSAVRII